MAVGGEVNRGHHFGSCFDIAIRTDCTAQLVSCNYATATPSHSKMTSNRLWRLGSLAYQLVFCHRICLHPWALRWRFTLQLSIPVPTGAKQRGRLHSLMWEIRGIVLDNIYHKILHRFKILSLVFASSELARGAYVYVES